MEIVNKSAIAAFINDESGQDLIEYALIAGLIALASIAGLQAFGTNISALFTTLSSKIPTQ